MKSVIVIPARMGSVRFPGKPLCDLLGKPMVQWVFEACVRSGIADNVVVATPDEVIAQACQKFGCDAIMTSASAPTGTDRITEVAKQVRADLYVNVQGDEPLIQSETISVCAGQLLDDESVQMASVFCECQESELDEPAVVKVVTDAEDFALYFSRYAIPFPRSPRPATVKKHVGIYAFRRDPLIAFARWPQSPLEIAESLEQLRFLHYGVRIKMAYGKGSEMAVDTPAQAEQVRRVLTQRMEGN